MANVGDVPPSPPDADSFVENETEDTGDLPTGSELVRKFFLEVLQGPNAGRRWQSTDNRCSIGSHPSNELLLTDPAVSRFHCEIKLDHRGALLNDLGSRNGTILDGVPVVTAYLRDGSTLGLGRSTLRFGLEQERNRLPLSERHQFGSLVGSSVTMRTTFALLERVAGANTTVLIEGETGTGKEGAAESIHQASERRDRPFVVVDCGSLPANLLEAELFGHERGAFTGAAARRIGAIEEAHTGTLFLDEVGELPLELQPKLLRAIEERQVRRLGSNQYESVDVRLTAATNRDLRALVNVGRFRADLYFRLAVIKVILPPLRNHPEDIPILAKSILESLGARPERSSALRTPEFLANLKRGAWPGNVRELRNYLERCLVLNEPLPIVDAGNEAIPEVEVDAHHPYEAERERAIATFEQLYVRQLLRLHGGKVSQAAAAAKIARVYLHRLMRKHGVKS